MLSPLPRTVCAGLLVAFAVMLLPGCKSAEQTAQIQPLTVQGVVILPDSTALFGAEISTEPTTGYVSTDEQGEFWMTLPEPNTYTFVATHPDPRYRDMEGQLTEVTVNENTPAPYLIIMLGRSQRMPLLDVNERAVPALRRGKKRTGQ
ncbi:MAG TPA: carboxypeptidase-like regulatory domain-containing protein [Rhodothermales bacterium]|nr:carboxypeptidase-like regulatory domain-containing protein [Rhodothermales bacterium]